jgi:hypothetical protein
MAESSFSPSFSALVSLLHDANRKTPEAMKAMITDLRIARILSQFLHYEVGAVFPKVCFGKRFKRPPAFLSMIFVRLERK